MTNGKPSFDSDTRIEDALISELKPRYIHRRTKHIRSDTHKCGERFHKIDRLGRSDVAVSRAISHLSSLIAKPRYNENSERTLPFL